MRLSRPCSYVPMLRRRVSSVKVLARLVTRQWRMPLNRMSVQAVVGAGTVSYGGLVGSGRVLGLGPPATTYRLLR